MSRSSDFKDAVLAMEIFDVLPWIIQDRLPETYQGVLSKIKWATPNDYRSVTFENRIWVIRIK